NKKTEYKSVPFFWTNQADLSLRYVGHAEQWNNIITWGNISSKKFISFYYKDETFLAAAAMDYDKELAALEALIKLNKVPPKEEIKNESIKLADLLN
ncbi:MAG: oxidoreductase C-terminal domain-containing protein, partial [Ignavibacteriaceae bacterium]